MRLGGKCGPTSADPLDLDVEVMGVVHDHTGGAWGGRIPMGLSVWLRTGGIDIAVCSIRTQLIERDSLTGLGIDLDGKRLIVVNPWAEDGTPPTILFGGKTVTAN
ncbi:MlrC C-terminal domain-containing protein [Paraburkholderia fungorum]|uniref:MlrC C-terminal domain-containing protein n=1 Tax=Paraburkholderia fungorum TaxID=134537 RepID=UPI0025B73B88|nr:MlrC C-terminal domain-containing protein [Paraburkholderia fungorum]